MIRADFSNRMHAQTIERKKVVSPVRSSLHSNNICRCVFKAKYSFIWFLFFFFLLLSLIVMGVLLLCNTQTKVRLFDLESIDFISLDALIDSAASISFKSIEWKLVISGEFHFNLL